MVLHSLLDDLQESVWAFTLSLWIEEGHKTTVRSRHSNNQFLGVSSFISNEE